MLTSFGSRSNLQRTRALFRYLLLGGLVRCGNGTGPPDQGSNEPTQEIHITGPAVASMVLVDHSVVASAFVILIPNT